jgi:hypothetical protein
MRHQLDGLISYFVKSLDEGFQRTVSEIQTYFYPHYSKKITRCTFPQAILLIYIPLIYDNKL